MKIPMQVNMNSATIIKIVARICGGKFRKAKDKFIGSDDQHD
jgi:hypothetical protein